MGAISITIHIGMNLMNIPHSFYASSLTGLISAVLALMLYNLIYRKT